MGDLAITDAGENAFAIGVVQPLSSGLEPFPKEVFGESTRLLCHLRELSADLRDLLKYRRLWRPVLDERHPVGASAEHVGERRRFLRLRRQRRAREVTDPSEHHFRSLNTPNIAGT